MIGEKTWNERPRIFLFVINQLTPATGDVDAEYDSTDPVTASFRPRGVVLVLRLDTAKWGADSILKGVPPPHQYIVCDDTVHGLSQGL